MTKRSTKHRSELDAQPLEGSPSAVKGFDQKLQ